MQKLYPTAAAALDGLLRDGMLIAAGGFGLCGLPERLIEADWGAPRGELFPVDIVVDASDRQGLLRDISELLSREKINVTAVNTQTRQHQARMAFTLEVESVGQLKRALALARDIPGVFAAERR